MHLLHIPENHSYSDVVSYKAPLCLWPHKMLSDQLIRNKKIMQHMNVENYAPATN